MRINLMPDANTRHRAEVKRDAVLVALKDATPQQIEAWIDNNVTSLAEARAVLKALAKAVALLIRKGAL